MRKSSNHAFKRGTVGRLRSLAHHVANSKFQQLVQNTLLLSLLAPFGINERTIYTQQYGAQFTNMVFGKAENA